LTGDTEKPREPLAREDQASELLLMGLRLREGIDPNRFFDLSGHNIDQSAINELIDLNLLHVQKDRIIVSNQGFMILNAVLRCLLEA
jgi:coproporphyrinogen III oxidase-like Fe-S oxidoreductase